jgi:DNA repair protein RadD
MTNEEIAKFFHETTVRVEDNAALREPQIGGYLAVHDHFAGSREPCYVQLPVGSGKTGLMGITPFGLASGRVLILTPNVTIRDTVRRELDISRPDCFYLKRDVLVPSKGPFISELKHSTAQIGSTPKSSRWASMKRAITSLGGRAPPSRNTLTPVAGSRWRAAARRSRARAA